MKLLSNITNVLKSGSIYKRDSTTRPLAPQAKTSSTKLNKYLALLMDWISSDIALNYHKLAVDGIHQIDVIPRPFFK